MTTKKVTRVEVIDHTKDIEHGGGRAYVNTNCENVDLELQDDGRTLKVFISKIDQSGADGINSKPILKFTTTDDTEPLVASGETGEMTPTTLNWQREFDEEVKNNPNWENQCCGCPGTILSEPVKAFIAQLLEEQRAEYVRRVEEAIKEERIRTLAILSGVHNPLWEKTNSLDLIKDLLTQKKEDNENT